MSNIHNGIFLTNTDGTIEEYSNNIGSNKIELQSKYNAIFLTDENMLLKEYANNLGWDEQESSIIET